MVRFYPSHSPTAPVPVLARITSDGSQALLQFSQPITWLGGDPNDFEWFNGTERVTYATFQIAGNTLGFSVVDNTVPDGSPPRVTYFGNPPVIVSAVNGLPVAPFADFPAQIIP